MNKESINEIIKEKAINLGFSECGFSKATFLEEDALKIERWLNAGYHASMQYMENHFKKRTDPTELVEDAKTVISLLLKYKTDERQKDPHAPILSKYAYGEDYHFVLKRKMKKLLEFMQENFGPVNGRVFVDSAPVLDRAWARRSGLGWIGKNSNLINRKHGSFVFIGEIICDLELECNEIPENDFCGACSICIDSCPTEAILPGRTIDSNKCISYQTIENRNMIPEILLGKFENRAFGCDICQDVCPWNREIANHHHLEFDLPEQLCNMSGEDWNSMTEKEFKALFKRSAVKRTGYKGLLRNLDFLKK